MSHSFRGRELEIKVPVLSGSGERPLSGGRFLVLYSHGRQSMLSHNSQKGAESAHEDSTLTTSPHPNYLSEAPPPNTTTLRSGVSTCEFIGGGGCKHLVHKTVMISLLLSWRGEEAIGIPPSSQETEATVSRPVANEVLNAASSPFPMWGSLDPLPCPICYPGS